MACLRLEVLEDRRTPDVTFASRLDFSFPSNINPLGLAVGDFNSDGRPDLAAVSPALGTSIVSVMLNTSIPGGVPTFAAPVGIASGIDRQSLAVGDVNADGRPDVVTAGFAGNVLSVHLNTSTSGAATPTFASPRGFMLGGAATAVVLSDINGDGRPDIAAASPPGNFVCILLNTTATGATDPSFATSQTFAAGNGSRGITAADFNGDGRPDLVTANERAGTVAVLLNTTAWGAGAAAFATARPFAAGAGTWAVAVGDFNGDGSPDVAATNNFGGTASVYLNATPAGATAPAFAAPLTLAAGATPRSVAVADVDRDGRPDLLVANLDGGAVTVFPNDTPAGATSAAFLPPVTLSVGKSPHALVVADLNSDLAADVAVSTVNSPSPGVAAVFRNTTPPPPPPPLTPAPTRPVAIGGPTDGSVLLVAPDGRRSIAFPFGSGSAPVRTATGDVNGDGAADQVAVTGPGTALRVAVLSGTDGSVLVAPFDPFGGSFLGGGYVAAADLDGDGRAEFAVTPDQGGGPRVTVFGRNPDGSTSVRANFFGIDDPDFRGGGRVALGDVNGDGVPDVVVAAGFGGGPRTAIFTGQSVLAGAPVRLVNDFFAFPGPDAVTLRNGSFVAAGDVTGDGFADLVFGGGPGGAGRVFILSGALAAAGLIEAAYASPVANFFVGGDLSDRGGARVAVTNSDGDAKADVAVGSGAGRPAKVRVYFGEDFAGSGEPPATELDPFGGAVLADGVYVG